MKLTYLEDRARGVAVALNKRPRPVVRSRKPPLRLLDVLLLREPLRPQQGMSFHVNFSMLVNGRIYRNDKS